MSESPKAEQFVRLNIRATGKTYSGSYSGPSAFGRAWATLKERTMDFILSGYISTLEKHLGELMFFIGDYLAEVVKSRMVPYGIQSNQVHVVTGSLISSIENQGKQTVRSFSRSVRAQIVLGIAEGARRYERSSLMSEGKTRTWNTGEPVSSYGVAKAGQLQAEAGLEEVMNQEVAALMSAGSVSKWRNSAALSSLISRTKALEAENMQKIEQAAMARLANAERRGKVR